MSNLEIKHVETPEEAKKLVAEGYCPVECSMGETIVDELEMDHHGSFSGLEGVALRAYRDHFGARKDDPRFVVTGAADADATFAIAALSAILPHPSREEELTLAPPHVKESGTQDLSGLAELINEVDTAPIGVRLEEAPFGDSLLLFDQLRAPAGNDALAFYAGVDHWRMLTSSQAPTALLEATRAEEASRVDRVRSVKSERVSDNVAVVEAEDWGFDVWYSELCPVVVAFFPSGGNISIGCINEEKAEELFGPGGLRNIFSRIGDGWGGRESIGGSPRGKTMTYEEALAAARVVDAAIRIEP